MGRESRVESTEAAAAAAGAEQSTALLLLITLRGLQYGTRVHTDSSLPCPALLLDRSSSKAKQSTALKTSQSLIKSLSTLCLSISQSVRPSSGSSGRPPTSQPVNQAAIDRFINQFIRRCTRSLTQSLNFSTTLIQPESPLSGLLCSLHPSLIFSRTARPHLACILHLAHLASIQSNPVRSSPGPIQSNPIRPSPHPPPHPPSPPNQFLKAKALPNFLPHTHAHTHSHTPLLSLLHHPHGPSPPDPGDRQYNRFKNNLQPSGSPPNPLSQIPARPRKSHSLSLREQSLPPGHPTNPFQPGTYARPAS